MELRAIWGDFQTGKEQIQWRQMETKLKIEFISHIPFGLENQSLLSPGG